MLFDQVDSVNKHGTLLQVVQVLADVDLTIKKAYISSDGGWFMDGMFRYLLLLHILYVQALHLLNLAFVSYISSCFFFISSFSILCD